MFLSVPSCAAPGCQHKATFPSAVSQRDIQTQEVWRLCPSLSCPCRHRDEMAAGWRPPWAHGALVAPGLGKTIRGIPKRRVSHRQGEAAWGRKGAALQLHTSSPSQGTPVEHPGVQAKSSDFGLVPACSGKTAPGVSEEGN